MFSKSIMFSKSGTKCGRVVIIDNRQGRKTKILFNITQQVQLRIKVHSVFYISFVIDFRKCSYARPLFKEWLESKEKN